MTVLRREGADAIHKGRPWGLCLEDRALLVAAYWRANLTMRQLATLFGVSKSTADCVIDHLGPMLALQHARVRQERRAHCGRHPGAYPRPHPRRAVEELPLLHEPPGRHRRRHPLVVVVGRPLPGNRNDCEAWEESGAKAAVGNTTTIADGGHPGTGLVMPHRRRKGEELPQWKRAVRRERVTI